MITKIFKYLLWTCFFSLCSQSALSACSSASYWTISGNATVESQRYWTAEEAALAWCDSSYYYNPRLLEHYEYVLCKNSQPIGNWRKDQNVEVQLVLRPFMPNKHGLRAVESKSNLAVFHCR
ncbi:hypothetical protein [Pleionea sp. CnH1-48]|uniref:hypothetical protein n=1 Tax=Pleionea sp. CnH1-48 TaxID=2954494 RepID=UPI002096CAB0|nr:hypothetical protein [Pleionea sp. CnH1-48]MCO7224180.1 hypothetical protein [Pleionea sp. CnH1-48]